MDKIFISNEIKLQILKVSGLPATKPYNLAGETRLDFLNYDKDEDFCRTLEYRLQEIASQYNTGKIILEGDISKSCTVSHCVKLVFP
ncbi:hypothetical protein SAMN05216490_5064 [Mucilaginibacter mallensis]|uniref:Uncharacterized protein n=1 Tax=Mucilaginibacter mallensis TaxID=652787 RepID=A0A1H2CHI4_MUCMA|nr:hypothetical protein [Mucilaginibacter mallensis]SDT69779.1 hypothetical protein SAMN05216490_5064 [Mucilaginibacter mallensis]